jgi:hypothetical protein
MCTIDRFNSFVHHVIFFGVQQVKQKILDSGGKNGIRTLGVILRRMDKNGNGVVEIEVSMSSP